MSEKLSYKELIDLATIREVEDSESVFYKKQVLDLPQTSFNGGLVSYIAPHADKNGIYELRVAHSTMGVISFTTVKVDEKVFEIVEK